MNRNYERDYIAKHQQIMNKLMEVTKESGCGCVSIPKIAAELGMDQRTVKAHLEIIELDHAGVFANNERKEFCTKEGVMLLAKRLGLSEITSEQDANLDLQR